MKYHRASNEFLDTFHVPDMPGRNGVKPHQKRNKTERAEWALVTVDSAAPPLSCYAHFDRFA